MIRREAARRLGARRLLVETSHSSAVSNLEPITCLARSGLGLHPLGRAAT